MIAALAAAISPVAPAAAKAVTTTYDGITLTAKSPAPGRSFDVAILSPEAGLKRLKMALDLIDRKSPHGRAGIARLKKFGKIFIIYDPNFPKPNQDISTIRRALFIPTFFGDNGKGKEGLAFPVLVSRHGINAPTEYLAAVLVHELVGHGIQQAEGRATTSRARELECEGWLQEEWAYQEFGVDKSSPEMIEFRRELEGSALSSGHVSFRRTSFLHGQSSFGASRDGQCSPFKRYLAEHAPDQLAHFNKLNPDVPELLKDLRGYVKYLDKSGVTTAALEARNAFQKERLDEILKSGSPDEQYRVALALKSGRTIALPQNSSRKPPNKGISTRNTGSRLPMRTATGSRPIRGAPPNGMRKPPRMTMPPRNAISAGSMSLAAGFLAICDLPPNGIVPPPKTATRPDKTTTRYFFFPDGEASPRIPSPPPSYCNAVPTRTSPRRYSILPGSTSVALA